MRSEVARVPLSRSEEAALSHGSDHSSGRSSARYGVPLLSWSFIRHGDKGQETSLFSEDRLPEAHVHGRERRRAAQLVPRR